MRPAGPRRTQEDDVVPGLDEVERAEMSDDLLADRTLIREVEVLERLVCREARRLDAVLAAVGLARRNLAL
jgi:hypothetical protein